MGSIKYVLNALLVLLFFAMTIVDGLCYHFHINYGSVALINTLFLMFVVIVVHLEVTANR